MTHGHVSFELAAALPREVVDALGLSPGDAIEYEVEGNSLRISRADDEEDVDLGLTDEQLRELIREALDDPRPPIPAEDVFTEIRARIEQRSRDGA